jgi:hypothetical protein
VKASSRKVYVSRVVVQCSSVPFDMMRYDNCVPDSEEDAHKLERIAHHSASREDRRVTFRRFAATPGES